MIVFFGKRTILCSRRNIASAICRLALVTFALMSSHKAFAEWDVAQKNNVLTLTGFAINAGEVAGLLSIQCAQNVLVKITIGITEHHREYDSLSSYLEKSKSDDTGGSASDEVFYMGTMTLSEFNTDTGIVFFDVDGVDVIPSPRYVSVYDQVGADDLDTVADILGILEDARDEITFDLSIANTNNDEIFSASLELPSKGSTAASKNYRNSADAVCSLNLNSD